MMCSDEKKLGAENDITEVYNNLRPRLHIVEKLVSYFCLQEKAIHLRGSTVSSLLKNKIFDKQISVEIQFVF